MVFYVLVGYWAQASICRELFPMRLDQKGEHFLEKSRLYPSADRTWGTILKKTSAVNCTHEIGHCVLGMSDF